MPVCRWHGSAFRLRQWTSGWTPERIATGVCAGVTSDGGVFYGADVAVVAVAVAGET